MTDRCQCDGCKGLSYITHASSCAVHDAPALPVGPCNCDAPVPQWAYFVFAACLAFWLVMIAGVFVL